jgi:hypothetical protein
VKTISAFAVGLALASTFSALPAQAQNARSFVSGHGSDAANCSLATPCRTLAAAFAVTNPSGEIDVLDAAGYGSLTINKAISIVNDGVGTAGVIVPSGGTGIIINAGTNDAVSLRGLSIEGGGTGASGIKFNSGKSLTVENCVIRHMTSDGIDFFSNTASTLTVSNSLVADNGNVGIFVQPSTVSSLVTAIVNRVEVNNNVTGIHVSGLAASSGGTVTATVSDSVAAGNSDKGFFVETFASGPSTSAVLTLVRAVAANNSIGVEAVGANATMLLAQTTVTGNSSFGWTAASAGTIKTYSDNYINAVSNQGSLTAVVRQ